MAILSWSVFFLFNVLCHAKFTPILLTVSIAIVGAVDLDDPCSLSLFPAYANSLNVYGEINLIDQLIGAE